MNSVEIEAGAGVEVGIGEEDAAAEVEVKIGNEDDIMLRLRLTKAGGIGGGGKKEIEAIAGMRTAALTGGMDESAPTKDLPHIESLEMQAIHPLTIQTTMVVSIDNNLLGTDMEQTQTAPKKAITA